MSTRSRPIPLEYTPDGIIDRRCTYDEYMHIAGQEAE